MGEVGQTVIMPSLTSNTFNQSLADFPRQFSSNDYVTNIIGEGIAWQKGKSSQQCHSELFLNG